MNHSPHFRAHLTHERKWLNSSPPSTYSMTRYNFVSSRKYPNLKTIVALRFRVLRIPFSLSLSIDRQFLVQMCRVSSNLRHFLALIGTDKAFVTLYPLSPSPAIPQVHYQPVCGICEQSVDGDMPNTPICYSSTHSHIYDGRMFDHAEEGHLIFYMLHLHESTHKDQASSLSYVLQDAAGPATV